MQHYNIHCADVSTCKSSLLKVVVRVCRAVNATLRPDSDGVAPRPDLGRFPPQADLGRTLGEAYLDGYLSQKLPNTRSFFGFISEPSGG